MFVMDDFGENGALCALSEILGLDDLLQSLLLVGQDDVCWSLGFK